MWINGGFFVLEPKIFEYLKQVKPGAGGEIQLTDALLTVAQKDKLLAYQFDGTRYDTGDRLGYLDATLAFGLRRPDVGPGLKKLIQKYSKTF